MIGWIERRREYSGSLKGVMVLFGWALYNVLNWCMIGFGFGTHNAEILWLYVASMGMLSLFGLAMYVSKLRHPLPNVRRRLPLRADAGLLGAFGIGLAGLGVIFGAWWFPFAGIFLVGAIWLAVKDVTLSRRKKPEPPLP